MKLAAIGHVSLALVLMSCGGAGAEAVDDPDGEETTSGGDIVSDGGDELDPCADSQAPCEGETAELETAEGETAELETAELETAEGETSEGETEILDPQAAWRAQIRVGRRWFNRRCDTCHPGGEEDIGPNIRGIRWPVARMRRQIRRGRGRMRPIPPARLPNQHIDALMAYLSTMRIVRGVSRPEAAPESPEEPAPEEPAPEGPAPEEPAPTSPPE